MPEIGLFSFFLVRSLSGRERHEVNRGSVFVSAFTANLFILCSDMTYGGGKGQCLLLDTSSVIEASVYLINVPEEMNNMDA